MPVLSGVTLAISIGGTSTYRMEGSSLTDQATKIPTKSNQDNGEASHIYGFTECTFTFTMEVPSEAVPSIRPGQFYTASSWGVTDGRGYAGTVGIDQIQEAVPNVDGSYTLQGTASFTGTVTRTP